MAPKDGGIKLSLVLTSVLVALVGILLCSILWWVIDDSTSDQPNAKRNDKNETSVIEYTDSEGPSNSHDLYFTDDSLRDKHPRFDPKWIDRRTLAGWQINQSEAVIKLDSPMVEPDSDAEMLQLHPSYGDALAAMTLAKKNHLPSANLLDAAAKQFDDGLMGAIGLACFEGQLDPLLSTPDWAEAVFVQLPQESPARPFLAAALQLADRSVEVSDAESEKINHLLNEFKHNRLISKPIAFYTWSPELKKLWRFSRFMQQKFTHLNLEIPKAVATVLEKQPDLKQQYQTIYRFQENLTNTLICLPVDQTFDSDEPLRDLAQRHGYRHAATALLPPSTSREAELFERLFPEGLSPDANLITELVRRIRLGGIDLAPDDSSGWHAHQAFAMQSLLLPGSNRESEKLFLTADYKRRLSMAFETMSKRRETHTLQLDVDTVGEGPLANLIVRPRLRLEPCPTFYLRTARAYAFVQNQLENALGRKALDEIKGLSSLGKRGISLATELDQIILRFQGFYLISCEDIGMRPEFLKNETVNRRAAEKVATKWLARLATDSDLLNDSRVAVPVFIDPIYKKTRHWGTLGVRMAHLHASFVQPPKVRQNKSGDWIDVRPGQLESTHYVILVDEFGEFYRGLDTITREEFRRTCDQHGTKKQILHALDPPTD